MLEHLRVLDLSTYLPGPYATQLLAELGADVVKVESPRGDPVRHIPPHDARGESVSFGALNRGKRSLVVDLKRPGGPEVLLRLVERADVLVETFRPGVLERLGVGPRVCLERNPRLVVCSISGYGQDGPYRERAGHDLNYEAYAGALSITTGADGLPIPPGVQVGDMLAGLAAFGAIQAALLARAETGRGRLIDCSMLDALVSAQGLHFATHAAGTPAKPRSMALNGGFPCYDVYRTADGQAFALGALEPKFWEVFLEIVGKPEWASRQFDPSLRPEVAALFATRGRDEWRLILENAGCCGSPVLSYDEVAQDPQVRHRGLLESGRTGLPFQLDPAPSSRSDLAPALGEHTQQVLTEAGFGAAEREALQRDGVVPG